MHSLAAPWVIAGCVGGGAATARRPRAARCPFAAARPRPPSSATALSRLPAAAHAKRKQAGGGGGDIIDGLLRFADKYAGVADQYLGLLGTGAGAALTRALTSSSGGSATSSGSRATGRAGASHVPFTAFHALLASLAAAWALTTGSSGGAFGGGGALALVPAGALALDRARWGWTWLTDAWLSPTPELLARNLFFAYVFGRTVHSAEGGAGLWLTYAASAGGAAAAALALLPRRAPLGGCAVSGALFGLFAAATALHARKAWHWHRWFELAALLPFVALQLAAPLGGLPAVAPLPGLRLPGACAPLLGGAAGAALAAALLLLARVVAAGIQQHRRQQQQQGGPPGGGGGGGGGGAEATAAPPQEPAALLTQAAALLLRRMVLP